MGREPTIEDIQHFIRAERETPMIYVNGTDDPTYKNMEDIVLRVWPDTEKHPYAIASKIKEIMFTFQYMEDYDKDKLHVFKVNPGPDWTAVGAEKYAILDITAWGGSEVMDKYASTYSNLQQIVDEGCPTFSPDLPLGWNAVNVNGLDVEKHDWHFRLVVSTSGIYGTP